MISRPDVLLLLSIGIIIMIHLFTILIQFLREERVKNVRMDSRLVDMFISHWNAKANSRWNSMPRLRSKKSINMGWCYQFALVLYKIYGGTLMTNDMHAWVELNGKCYDSNNLRGISKDRYRQIGKALNEEEFVNFWGEPQGLGETYYGASGPVHYDVIEEIVNVYLNQNTHKKIS